MWYRKILDNFIHLWPTCFIVLMKYTLYFWTLNIQPPYFKRDQEELPNVFDARSRDEVPNCYYH